MKKMSQGRRNLFLSASLWLMMMIELCRVFLWFRRWCWFSPFLKYYREQIREITRYCRIVLPPRYLFVSFETHPKSMLTINTTCTVDRWCHFDKQVRYWKPIVGWLFIFGWPITMRLTFRLEKEADCKDGHSTTTTSSPKAYSTGLGQQGIRWSDNMQHKEDFGLFEFVW